MFIGLGEVIIMLEVVLEGGVAEVKELLLRIAEEVVKGVVVKGVVEGVVEGVLEEGVVEGVVEGLLEEEAEEVLRAVK